MGTESQPSTPCDSAKVPPDIPSASIEDSKIAKMKEEHEKQIRVHEEKYQKLSTEIELKSRRRLAVLVLFLSVAYFNWLTKGTPPIGISPPLPPPTKTLEQLVLDKIVSFPQNKYDSARDNNLDKYLLNVNYYYKNFGKYPLHIDPSFVLERYFDDWYRVTPENTKLILDFYETNVNPLDQYPKIINFFKSRLFQFDKYSYNYYDANQYNNRVACIEQITSRISGRGIEDDILKELVDHQPRDFIFRMIKKYYPGAKLVHPAISKYLQKAKWFEEMIAANIWSETLSVNYLAVALEHHTVHYVGDIITKLVERGPSENHKKTLSFELIRYYAQNKLQTETQLNNLFDHLRIINYHFTTEDIKVISTAMNNAGREVENLWDAIRGRQQQFSEYYCQH